MLYVHSKYKNSSVIAQFIRYTKIREWANFLKFYKYILDFFGKKFRVPW